MIMTKSETNKLYKPIATDFKIIARKTGLMELDYCEKILYDIKVMIENDFLEKVSLILDKPKYTPFKDDRILVKEIPLMRFISEMVILSESSIN